MGKLSHRSSQFHRKPSRASSLVVIIYTAYAYLLYSKLGFLQNSQITIYASNVPMAPSGDGVQEVWFLAWPAYAIAHGLNPLWSSALAVPHGVNLLSNTSMPLLGILMTPFTWLMGPTTVFNFLMPMALALSATSAYFVSTRVGLTRFASFVVGLLYGFSSFSIAQGHAHLFLTFAPLSPLLFWLSWRLVRQEGPPRRLARWIAVLLSAEFLISAERVVLDLLAIALAAVVAAAFVTAEQRRSARVALRAALVPFTALFATLMAGPVAVSLFGPWAVRGNPHPWTERIRTDLAEFVFPNAWSHALGFGPRLLLDPLVGSSLERGAYVGIPLLALLLYGLWRYRQQAAARVLAILFAIFTVLSLGGSIWVNSRDTSVPSPLAWVHSIPVLSEILPTRYVFLVWVVVALGTGLFLSTIQKAWRESPSSLRPRHVVASVLGAALILWCLVPAARFSTVATNQSSWFGSPEYRAVVQPGDRALFYPYPNPLFNNAMLIQSEMSMRFSLIGGEAIVGDQKGHNQGVPLLEPTSVSTALLRPFWGATNAGIMEGVPGLDELMPPRGPETVKAFHEFVRRYRVSIIIATKQGSEYDVAAQYVTDAFGPPRVRDHGAVKFWIVRTAS